MAYNTNNPLGSKDPRDLYDNATNFDYYANGDDPMYPNRFGELKLSIEGMNEQFIAAQDGREAQFDATLAAIGFTWIGDYGAGLNFTTRQQYTVRAGLAYTVDNATTLPYTTTGVWATDEVKLKLINSDQLLRVDLIDPTKGADLVAYDPGKTYAAGTVGKELQNAGNTTIDSVFALATAPQSLTNNVSLASYHTGWAAEVVPPKGGGLLRWAPNVPKSAHNGCSIFSPTVPWNGTQAALAAYLAGTGETLPAGNGCFVRLNPRGSVFECGARANNTDNDFASFQKAGDVFKTVFVPNGNYAMTGTILFNSDGVSYNGESMSGTVLNFAGAGTCFKNPVSAGTTRLFIGLNNLRINALAAGANAIVDWTSIQFGRISKVWILGQSINGCIAVKLAATWVTTECTYNVIEDCYMGLFAQGITISDGANNNNIWRNRFQPSLSGGIGIFLSATAAGRVSVINIIGNGFEYPGAISTGINILQNCDFINIQGNRFEQLLNGIVVGATGNKHISGTSRTENYFESCTNAINHSAGAIAGRPGVVAAGAYASGVALGNPFGFSAVSNPSTGVYGFTYADTTYPDAGQTVQVTSTADRNVVSQTAAGFTVTCQTAAGANVAATLLGVTVLYNK